MLIQKVTGKDFRTVTRQGVLKNLRHTYWPRQHELDIRGRHAHTYGVNPFDPKSQGKVVDTTLEPGRLFGASGGLISTPDDLNRFWQSLATSTIKAMLARTVPANDPPKADYGLGVYSYPFACGPAWMHDGGLPGTRVLSGRDRSGRAVTLYVTGTPKNDAHIFEAFGTVLCGEQPGPSGEPSRHGSLRLSSGRLPPPPRTTGVNGAAAGAAGGALGTGALSRPRTCRSWRAVSPTRRLPRPVRRGGAASSWSFPSGVRQHLDRCRGRDIRMWRAEGPLTICAKVLRDPMNPYVG